MRPPMKKYRFYWVLIKLLDGSFTSSPSRLKGAEKIRGPSLLEFKNLKMEKCININFLKSSKWVPLIICYSYEIKERELSNKRSSSSIGTTFLCLRAQRTCTDIRKRFLMVFRCWIRLFTASSLLISWFRYCFCQKNSVLLKIARGEIFTKVIMIKIRYTHLICFS